MVHLTITIGLFILDRRTLELIDASEASAKECERNLPQGPASIPA